MCSIGSGGSHSGSDVRLVRNSTPRKIIDRVQKGGVNKEMAGSRVSIDPCTESDACGFTKNFAGKLLDSSYM